jgi:hypothetical protein
MGHSVNPRLIDTDNTRDIRIPKAKHVIVVNTDEQFSIPGAENKDEIEVIHVPDGCDWHLIKSQRIYPHGVMETICRALA